MSHAAWLSASTRWRRCRPRKPPPCRSRAAADSGCSRSVSSWARSRCLDWRCLRPCAASEFGARQGGPRGLEQLYLTQFVNVQLFIDAPHGLRASPGTAVAVDAEEIIGGGGVAAMRERGRRRHADRRDGAVRAVDPYRRMNVVVPVQDQVHAMAFQE